MESIIPTIITNFLSSSLKVIIIIVITAFAFFSFNLFINRILSKIKQKNQRVKTIKQVLVGTSRFVIILISLLMILSELGLDIAPILASVGLAGLAIGMGSREIIADFLSGIFILIDNIYQIGDEIKIGQIEGKVEAIDLRKTVLSDKEGKTHIIPNGRVKEVTKNG